MNIDDEIAGHASARGHWPGKSIDEIKAMIDDVRNGWNNRYMAPSGEIIYRKGDVILIENPPRARRERYFSRARMLLSTFAGA
ncbi:MAG: hypothetical protein HY289_07080 [Planctomycetes bacterium]|nr:hypothetical protein [Planctomycetota bacterium]